MTKYLNYKVHVCPNHNYTLCEIFMYIVPMTAIVPHTARGIQLVH